MSNTATFTVDGRSFAAATSLVGKACRAAGGITGDGMVTLAFRDQRVTVEATDLETSVSIKLPVKGRKAVTVAVDAGPLVTFAKAIADADVEITTSSDEVRLVSGDVVFTMRPFPDPWKVQHPDSVDPQPLNPELLSRAARFGTASAATDDARPIITGVLFDNGISVSTDSYKLIVNRLAPPDLNGLIPAKALQLAASVFGTDCSGVTVEVVDRKLLLRSDMKAVTVRVIEGDYPRWQNLLDIAEARGSVTADRAELVDALRKCVLAADDSTPTRFSFVDGQVKLAVRVHDGPAADADVAAEIDGILPTTIGLNASYLLKLLLSIDDDVVTLDFIDEMKPVRIVEPAGEWSMLLMPVRIP